MGKNGSFDELIKKAEKINKQLEKKLHLKLINYSKNLYMILLSNGIANIRQICIKEQTIL